METKIGFLETYNKESGMVEKSDIRLKTTYTLIAGLLMAFYCIVTNQLDVNSMTLILTIIGYAFGAKVIQKFTDNKQPKPTDYENAKG